MANLHSLDDFSYSSNLKLYHKITKSLIIFYKNINIFNSLCYNLIKEMKFMEKKINKRWKISLTLTSITGFLTILYILVFVLVENC